VASALWGQESAATCAKGLTADVPAGTEVRLQLRAAEVDILGADAPRLKITCELSDRVAQADKVKLTAKLAGSAMEVGVAEGPWRDVHLRIEIPKNSNLWLRSRNGDVLIEEVVGNKDVEVRTGNLMISVGNATQYAHADGSVKLGDLTAFAFGFTRDGWNRHFEKENPAGKYRLHAHVGIGDLVLQQ
jgi:hypothetical protein